MNVAQPVPLLQTSKVALVPSLVTSPLSRPPANTKEDFSPLLDDLIGKIEVVLRGGLPAEQILNLLGRRTPAVPNTVNRKAEIQLLKDPAALKGDDKKPKPASNRTAPASATAEPPSPLPATTMEVRPEHLVGPEATTNDTSSIQEEAPQRGTPVAIPTAGSLQVPFSVPPSLESNPFSDVVFGLRLAPITPKSIEPPRISDTEPRPELPRELRIETPALAGTQAGPEAAQVLTPSSNTETPRYGVEHSDPALPRVDLRNQPEENWKPGQSLGSVTPMQGPKPTQVELRPERRDDDGSRLENEPEPLRPDTRPEPISDHSLLRAPVQANLRQAAILSEARTDSEKPSAASRPLSGTQDSLIPKPADRHDSVPPRMSAAQCAISSKPREETDEQSGSNPSPIRQARAQEDRRFADAAPSRNESHATASALGTQPLVAEGQVPALTRPDRPAADISPPPQAEIQAEANLVARPQSASHISLKLPGDGGARVDVDLIERAGKVQIAVRTPDRELAKSLRTDLPDLVGRLENKGFKADAWVPASGHTTAEALARPVFSSGDGDSKNPGSGAGQEPGRQHHNGSNQRQRTPSKAQFEAAFSSDELEKARTEKQ